jgi:hypothetical protein
MGAPTNTSQAFALMPPQRRTGSHGFLAKHPEPHPSAVDGGELAVEIV